jgi:hypothetical protein
VAGAARVETRTKIPWRIDVRLIKLSLVLALALALAASSAFAGANCGAKTTSTASADNCLQSAFAGASNHCTTSKAKLSSMVSIETTKLPSGALVVMYRGKDASSVAYLQAAAAKAACDFCCPMTSKLASNKDCKVEIAKTKDGAVVVVTSEKPEVVAEYETSLMELASNN